MPENILQPMYNNEDEICGIISGGIPYYFVKNLQGDIIAITDHNGQTVARYTYDAWGVPTVTCMSGCSIGNDNPFRYRGYYYDTDTNLYYLQSRYYDASIGRFLNSDDFFMVILGNDILTKNIYLYCENCAVIKADYTGFTSTTTYGGITCFSAYEGPSVKMHVKFLSKIFCKNYAKHVIKTWGDDNKYCGMNATRIAQEVFGHAILFVLGIVVGVYSIWNLVYAWKAKYYLSKIAGIVRAAISGYVAYYLIDRSKEINVNSNESWYRVAAFWVIWNFFLPVVW